MKIFIQHQFLTKSICWLFVVTQKQTIADFKFNINLKVQ